MSARSLVLPDDDFISDDDDDDVPPGLDYQNNNNDFSDDDDDDEDNDDNDDGILPANWRFGPFRDRRESSSSSDSDSDEDDDDDDSFLNDVDDIVDEQLLEDQLARLALLENNNNNNNHNHHNHNHMMGGGHAMMIRPQGGNFMLHRLISTENWDQVRTQLATETNEERIEKILFKYVEILPDDIFAMLFQKGCDKSRYGIFWVLFHPECFAEKFVGRMCSQQSAANIHNVLNVWVKYLMRSKDPRVDYRMKGAIVSIWQHAKFKLDAWDPAAGGGIRALENSQDEDMKKFLLAWQTTERLVQISMQLQPQPFGWRVSKLPLVHKLLQLRVPKLVVWIALQLYPEQASIACDKTGKLPLHIAAELNNDKTEPPLDDKESSRQGDPSIEILQYHLFTLPVRIPDVMLIMEWSMVEVVLRAFPAGASCEDKNGNLPLDILLAVEYEGWFNYDWTERCLMAVVSSYPDALSRPCQKYPGMLPFMLVASIHHCPSVVLGNKAASSKQMKKRKLDLAFALLRECPNAVKFGMKGCPKSVANPNHQLGTSDKMQAKTRLSRKFWPFQTN